MAKFKQVPQSFLFEKLVRFWGNMVKNYQGNVCEDNFFRILNRHFDHAKAVKLVEAAYTPDEIKKMSECRSRCNRLDLDDSLDDVFQQLWNREKKRGKCRAILKKIQEDMVARHPRSQNELLEKRFLELKRIFRLTDLEYDILLVAYVVEETCFHWPRHIEDREKPLYFAMALDRSYSEVSRVMTGKGRLRMFDLLDDDWDFNSRVLGGFLDGTEDEPLERRFYGKNGESEILPWSFYGQLAATDGGILRRLLAGEAGKCNILFYGAPGTGKTEFVKYLGKELDRKVLVVKGADLLSKWVGESEQNIAKFFRRAEAEHAILFFDEIDGLVQDRANARASWEISQVNELLQQMENFNGVMIAATNFRANLDPAIMRRFTFKLEFGYLDDDGKKSFFERMFKTTLTDAEFTELKALGNLAPGDFRTVRQESFYLGETVSNADLIASLGEECRHKKGGERRAPIGFAAT